MPEGAEPEGLLPSFSQVTRNKAGASGMQSISLRYVLSGGHVGISGRR